MSRWRRWMGPLLLASLVLNLFLAGILVGDALSRPWRGPRPPDAAIERQIARLPEAQAAEVRAILGPHRAAIAGHAAALARARNDLFRLFTADPFDPAAMEAELDAFNAETQGLLAEIRAVVLELGAALPPEGRAALLPRRRSDRP